MTQARFWIWHFGCRLDRNSSDSCYVGSFDVGIISTGIKALLTIKRARRNVVQCDTHILFSLTEQTSDLKVKHVFITTRLSPY